MARFGPACSLAAMFAGLVLAPGFPALGARAEQNDLREFRIGMSADDLPRVGYEGFGCAAAPSRELGGFEEFRSCPADADGLHVVSFGYDETAHPLAGLNDRYEGTKVFGHPVRLSLAISDAGQVEGIRLETDSKARLYLRKKAFLLGPQIRERFGPADWSCTQDAPGKGEEPVGGVFVKEHCEKVTATRRFILDRELFRRAGEDIRNFVSGTRLAILRPSGR